MINTPAIIFSGGKSSRMGQDKALLPFSTYTTLGQYQYEKLSKLFTNVYLSIKEQKFDFACQTIIDIYEESSPLVALVSCFEALEAENIFVLSVDAPLVDKEIIVPLYETSQLPNNQNKDAIIAKSPKGVQPLCGFYKRSILPLARAYLSNHKHKLTALLDEANTFYLPFDKETAFTNLNTMPQYQDLLFSQLNRT